jgi:hypothetical protein
MLVLTLVFGLIVTGCDNGTTEEETPNPFIGTWEQNDGQRVDTLIITKTGWTWQINEDNYAQGTYSYEGNTVTLLTTHKWDDDSNTWELETDARNQEPFTLTLSSDGNSLEDTESQYQKEN